jgi:AcrR family transcriptional regulator
VDTRSRILETATRLFSLQGYDNTSLSQVASEAKVSKALIFWHFENKEALFRAALQRTLEPFLIDVLDDPEDLSEADQIKRLIDEYYEFVSKNLYPVKFLLSLIVREEKRPDDLVGHVFELQRLYRNQLAAVIERGRRNGLFRPTVSPLLDAALIVTTLNGILVQGLMGNAAPEGSGALLAHLKQTLVDGLRA